MRVVIVRTEVLTVAYGGKGFEPKGSPGPKLQSCGACKGSMKNGKCMGCNKPSASCRCGK